MGVLEQLAHYRSKARAVVVAIVPAQTFPNFDAAAHARLGDFVIITERVLGKTQHPTPFHGRLPERALAGKIAVAFVVAVRDREAGVADLTDRV